MSCVQHTRRYAEPVEIPGAVQMAEIVSFLDATLESDAIMTNGAGNYSGFLHRFFKFKDYGTQLAPTSGSMGYGRIDQLVLVRSASTKVNGCEPAI